MDGPHTALVVQMTGSNATLGGTGPLTVTGNSSSNFLFNAGTISGLTVNTNALQLDSLNSQSFLNNATVNITGTGGGWTMQSSLVGQGASRVTVLPGAQFAIRAATTSLNAAGTATLSTTGGGTLQFDNNGTVALGLVTFAPWTLTIGNGVTFNNAGTFTTLRARVIVSAGGTLNNSGSFTVDPGSSSDEPSQLMNSGTVAMLGGTFSVPDGAALNNFSSGLLSGGTWRAVNAGFDFGTRSITSIAASTTVELSGSASFPALNSLVQNSGTLRVLGGATFKPTGASINTNGTVEVGSGSTFAKGIVVQSGGILTGAGTIGGAVTVQAGGRITPGSGVGTLTVNAPVTVNGGTGTTWNISFVGVPSNTPATASTQASRIAVGSSTLNLAASSANPITLNLILAGGTPTMHQPVSYVVATAASGTNYQTNGGSFAFDASQFNVTTAGFVGVDSFQLIVIGDNLVLQFVPVPEPAFVLTAALALALPAGIRRFRPARVS